MTASTAFGFRVIGEVIKKDGSRKQVIGDNDSDFLNIDALLLELLSYIDIIGWLKLKYLYNECLPLMHSLGKPLKLCD